MDEPSAAAEPHPEIPAEAPQSVPPAGAAVESPAEEPVGGDEEPEPPPRALYRHTLPTRIAHWIVVLCLPILTLSGFQIFNAHPALYWGDRSDPDRSLFALRAVATPSGDLKGVTQVLGVELDTTGVLGASRDGDGRLRERGFPGWATIPSEQWLAMGRRWHFFFAWVLVLTGLSFGLYAVVSRHFTKDLVPWPRDLRTLFDSIRDHLRFRHPTGDAATRYNVLQKIAYTSVIFGLAPFIVLTGLAMSPRFDAAAPLVVQALGGRQSARTLHFLATFAFVGFTLSHLFMVAVTGVVNNVRSMVTGWFRLPEHGGMEHNDPSD